MRGSVSTEREPKSISDAVRSWFYSLPLVTKSLFTLMVALHLAGLLTGYDDVYPYCLSAAAIAEFFQVYRIFTAVLFHVGLLHIAFNMMTFVPYGTSLERLAGSIKFGYLILVITVLEAVLYLAVAYAMFFTMRWKSIMTTCAIGFSGVIFGLIVVDTSASGVAQRSIFGLFTVPAQVYPWALILLCQLILPNASFLGHVCGAMVGQLWVWGFLKRLELSHATVAWLEVSAMERDAVPHGFIYQPVMPVFASTGHVVGNHHHLRDHPDNSFGPSIGSFVQLFGAQQQQQQKQQQQQQRPAGASSTSEVPSAPPFHGPSHTIGGALPGGTPPRTAASVAAEARQGDKGGGNGSSPLDAAAKKGPLGRPASSSGRESGHGEGP